MTAPAEATVLRYRDAALALLPPGRAIAKALGSNVALLFEGVAVEFARLHEDSETVVDNSLPTQSETLLDEWEDALALPGSCVTTPTTAVAERRGAIIAKLRGRTSHSQATYDSAALALGYDDLEYDRYVPFSAGAGSVGDSVYSDEWANVVRVSVPVGDQTADAELQCVFTDQLRRSHGYLDIILEGPMGATRTHYTEYHNGLDLGASVTAASITALVELKYQGFLSVQVVIDNGAGAAPSDTPVGLWTLWASTDGVDFSQLDAAAVTTELAVIAPNGNNVVSECAVFQNCPGRYVKVAYARTSGGGGNTDCHVHLTTW